MTEEKEIVDVDFEAIESACAAFFAKGFIHDTSHDRMKRAIAAYKEVTKDHEIEIYALGPLSLSVCAPKNLSKDEILRQVEFQNPAGTQNGWMF